MSERMRSADRRRLLAQTTRDIIQTEGEKAATVRNITSRAGMPLSSFHYVFESREEALRETWPLLRAPDIYFDAGDIDESMTMEDGITAMLIQWFRGASEHRLQELGELELFVHSLRNEELQHLPRTFQRDYEDRIIAGLAVMADRLGVRAAIPARQLARLVLIITNGASKSILINGDDIDPTDLIPPLVSGFNRFFVPVESDA